MKYKNKLKSRHYHLKTPLATIQTAVGALIDVLEEGRELKPKRLRDYLSIISNNSERLEYLIKKSLKVS